MFGLFTLHSTPKEACSCLKDLSILVVRLRDIFEIILERAVAELRFAHRLGDERVVVLIWTGLNHGNAESRVILFETRC